MPLGCWSDDRFYSLHKKMVCITYVSFEVWNLNSPSHLRFSSYPTVPILPTDLHPIHHSHRWRITLLADRQLRACGVGATWPAAAHLRISLQTPTLPGDSVEYLSSKWCAGHLNFWSRNFRNSIFLWSYMLWSNWTYSPFCSRFSLTRFDSSTQELTWHQNPK